MIVIKIVLAIFFAYLAFNTIYVFVFAVLGRFFYSEKQVNQSGEPQTKFLLLLPSYKNEEIALESATAALEQTYPKDLFEVLVIADHFTSEGIQNLTDKGVSVLAVNFENSTKAQSLNEALRLHHTMADSVIILDVDNVMQADALKRTDELIRNGQQVIQLHRTAKNTDTTTAYLDSVSEEINNTIFRRGQRSVGLTCALIGSGMVFPYALLKELMSHVTAIGGFDKELEMYLANRKIKAHYNENILVFDEKVRETSHLEKQRTRWIAAQVVYARKFFGKALSKLFNGDFNYWMKYIQTWLVPRILMIGLLTLLMVSSLLGIIVVGDIWIEFKFLIISWLLYMVALVVAIPGKMVNGKMARAIFHLPKAIFTIVLVLFKLKGANKTFIHTPHSSGK